MAQTFLPFDGSKAKFVLPLIDNGGGTVTLTPSRPGQGLVLPTFTRATAATTVLANGLIGSVASGAARSYYDPTSLAYLGYLAEGARTNLLLQSADTTNASWTKVDVTPTLSGVGPDGGANTANLWTCGVAGTSAVSQAVTATADVGYSKTIWAKRGNTDWFFLRISATGASADFWFNLATGVVGSTAIGGTASANSISIKAYTNGFYRVGGTATMGGGQTAITVLMTPVSGDGVTTRVNNATVSVWGADFEVGAFPSTYKPTTVATFTRNADVLTYPLTGWYAATGGTLFGQGRFSSISASNFTLASINDTSADNHIWQFQTGGTGAHQARAATVNQCNITVAGVAADADQKYAGAFVANDFQFARNGTLGTADTSGTIPTVTRLEVGSDAGTLQMFGTISSIGYWSERLSNNDLLYITTNDVDFTIFTPAPTGGSIQTNIPAAFHARGQSDEQKRRSRVKFGLEKEVEKVIERVAENQVQRQERDAQKRYEQLTRELEISGIEYQARYLELLNVQRDRLIEARVEEVKKEIQAQADIASLVQSGQQAVDEHYSKIAQQLEQFAADSAQVNQQFIQMLQTFDHEYRAELLRYVPADLLRRRR